MLVTDNAHVVQTRLILLDAPLVLFMALSFYSYIRFYKLRYRCAPSASSAPHRNATDLSNAASSRSLGGLGCSLPASS